MKAFKSFSTEEKLALSKLLNAELVMADGSTTTMGMYLWEVLPELLQQYEDFYKPRAVNCAQLIACAMEYRGEKDLQKIASWRHLNWEDGSMEHHFGTVEDVYAAVKDVQKYCYGQHGDKHNALYMNAPTSLRQSYQAAIYTRDYKTAFAQMLATINNIKAGKPVDTSEESILFTGALAEPTILEIMFNEENNRPGEDGEYKDIVYRQGFPAQQAELLLSIRDKITFPPDKRPADAEAFDRNVKFIAAMLKNVLTSKSSGMSRENNAEQ